MQPEAQVLPLEHLAILDLSDSIAGGYCTKLLADAGAEVVKVEPPGGDRLRQRSLEAAPGDEREKGLLFAYLSANKRGITLDLTTPSGVEALQRMLPAFDLVVETLGTRTDRTPEASFQRLAAGAETIWLSISPFGLTGPYAAYLASDLVLQAVTGWMVPGGERPHPPLRSGGEISEFIVGTWGAVAALAALEHKDATGRGQAIDLGAFEAMLSVCSDGPLSYSVTHVDNGIPLVNSTSVRWPILPCKNGWVGINPLTPAHFELLCQFMGRPELVQDPRFVEPGVRVANARVLNTILAEWTSQHTKEELFAANEWRVPIALVPTVAEILEFPQHKERHFLIEQNVSTVGTLRRPRLPLLSSEYELGLRRPAPELGEHNAEIVGSTAPPPPRMLTRVNAHQQKPLAGVRVVDLTMWWAGPFTTKLLADLGAEVVKVESVQVMDGWRGAMASTQITEGWWEKSLAFIGVNRNKAGITLDLQRPGGVALLEQLVACSDVVVENYTPRVMPNFGLDYGRLRTVNPQIIMCSLPAYGRTGPWREYSGFASPVEEMAGFPQLTGYEEDGIPRPFGNSAADSIAGLTGTYAVLMALQQRSRTGRGQLIDMSQVEVLTAFLGEQLMTYQVSGRIPSRTGNHHPHFVPHNLYPTGDEVGWVAITVTADDQWPRLCQVLSRDDWATDEALTTALGRRQQQAALDAGIASWTASRDRFEVMTQLQRAGVPCMPLMTPAALLWDPQLRDRGYFQTAVRENIGPHEHGIGWAHFGAFSMSVDRPAPTLGEHNEEVLGGLLGLGADELAELERRELIGSIPVQMKPRF